MGQDARRGPVPPCHRARPRADARARFSQRARTRAYGIGLSGHRDEAVDLLQDILTRVPDAATLHFILAQLCLQEPRDIPRYLDQMRRFSELRHSSEELAMMDDAEPAYRSSGESAMWQAMLAVEERLHPSPHDRTFRQSLKQLWA